MKFGELLMASQMDGGIDDPKNPKPGTRAYELKNSARKKFGVDNLDALTLARNAVKNIPGVMPEMLLGSAYQEGMNQVVAGSDPDPYSGAYYNAGVDKTQFPVDAFRSYGVDKFTEYLPRIQKYLPQGFEKEYQVFPAANEADERQWATKVVPLLKKKGLLKQDYTPDLSQRKHNKTMEVIYDAADKYGQGLPELNKSLGTAAFRNNQDAMIVKAAILKDAMDEMEGYAKQKGYVLDEDAKNYFNLARYNASPETSKAMMDEYAAAKDKKAFLEKGVYKNKYGANVHANVSPRLENMAVARELLKENPLGNEPPTLQQVIQ
jgi:hypothetical protein